MTTTTATVALPEASGGWREIELSEPRAWAEHPQPFESRIAFAAAHVVADVAELATAVDGARRRRRLIAARHEAGVQVRLAPWRARQDTRRDVERARRRARGFRRLRSGRP